MPAPRLVDGRAARLLTGLRDRRGAHLELLERLVEIDSQWSNPAGVARVGHVVGAALAALGFTIERVPQPTLDDDLRWVAELLGPGRRPEDLAPTVVATRDGVGEHRLLVLGDCDTAFPATDAEFRVDGELARGVGVADMKAGLVVLVEALRALDDDEVPCPPVTIVLAGDEQAGSLGSRAVIRERAAGCRLALCMECARDGGHLMGSRAHIGVGVVEAVGREAHAGTSRADGISAIRALAEVVPAIDDLSDDEVLATVTMVAGGRRRSVVPGSARAVVDLRARDPQHWPRLVAAIDRVLDANGSSVDLSLRSHVHRPGVTWTSATDMLLARLGDAADRVGVALPGAVPSLAAGSSAFAAEAGLLVLDGLGPPGGDLMTADEHVLVPGIAERAAVLAAFLEGLATTPLPAAA